MPPLKRKTGDLDLSVGLIKGAADYTAICQILTDHGYKLEPKQPPYRYFPEKTLPGALAYIDLLAHPADAKISKAEAITAMHAGRGWSFAKFDFVRKTAFKLSANSIYPNPIALIALKAAAYEENPLERLKDLADIAELCWGLVEKGAHFQLAPLWENIRQHTEASEVKIILAALGGEESAKWVREAIEQELRSRNFSTEEIAETIPARILELVENLPL